MENRILVIADSLFGESGEAADRFAEILLCEEPARPLQFVLNAPLPYPLQNLPGKIAFEIIGKQAGRIVLGLGAEALLNGASVKEMVSLYRALIEELLKKTSSKIFLVTLPLEIFEDPSDAIFWNHSLNSLACARVKIIDFSSSATDFFEKQKLRGKFARPLFGKKGIPTPTGGTFLALNLQRALQIDFAQADSEELRNSNMKEKLK